MRNEPETIEDLESRYYGANKNGKNVHVDEIKRYEDYLRTHDISDFQEDDVQNLFSPLGKVRKIQRARNKTYDFEIEGIALIEVTSINTTMGEKTYDGNISLSLPCDENKFIERINRCITHAEEKESHDGYFKFLVIFYDDLLLVFGKGIARLSDPEFVRKTHFCNTSIDAVIFLPHQTAGNIETPEWLGYAKERRVFEMLSKIKGLEMKILECGEGKKE